MKKFFFVSALGLFLTAGAMYAQTLSSTTPNTTLTESGLDLYNAHNYKDAITSFNKAIKENPKDGKAFYYRGLAKMHDGQKGFCKDLEESMNLGYSTSSDIYFYGCDTHARQ
jgi:tetratricopeptide (TPR) repeat protein